MDRATVASIVIKLFYWYCKLLGLCPVHYDFQQNAFVWTWYEIFYSVLIWMNFSYFYWTRVLNLIKYLNPVLVFIYFTLNLLTLATVFLVQCFNAGKLAELLNQLLDLLQNECKAIRDTFTLWQIVRYGARFFQKIIFINGVAMAATMIFCETLSMIVTGQIDYFVNLVMASAYILQMLIPNMFYAFILVISIHLRHLNVEIQKFHHQANELITVPCAGIDGLRNRYNQLNKLSQRLEDMSKIHCKIEIIVRHVNQVFSWQLLITIYNAITNILIEVNFKLKEKYMNSRKRSVNNRSLVTCFRCLLSICLCTNPY